HGKHIGIITNHTGLDSQGKSTIDALAHAPGVQIVAIFSPEHGLSGQSDERVSSAQDPSTGLQVFSLYGETLRPTDEMLKGVDTLVFDIQDAGVRFYTYTVTMAYCMEEAAKRNVAFYVLDRPNPIGGEIVEGPILDPDKTNFVAYFPIPVRYGLTIGELAQYFNSENHINADLHVIAMKNWHRNYFFESTGLRWIPPSPNLRTMKGSIAYPGLEILQNAGVSVGRGTEAPFEEFGAPWIDGEKVAAALDTIHLPGLRFVAQPFIPVSGLYAGRRCGGVAIRIVDRAAVRAMRMGLEIAILLQKMYPENFDASKSIALLGNAETVQKLKDGVPAADIVISWQPAVTEYDKTRRRYFLYK
ncbi:MAG: serine hydrolase, partial [Acidobacteria bacterium]